MSDEPIDLSPLDPMGDEEEFERIVGAITQAAAIMLVARRARYGPVAQVARLWRPTLAAAAALAALAVATLASGAGESDGADAVAATSGVRSEMAAAVGVPTPLAGWIHSDTTPTAAELIVALQEVSR
jgi:hypothetical protein